MKRKIVFGLIFLFEIVFMLNFIINIKKLDNEQEIISNKLVDWKMSNLKKENDYYIIKKDSTKNNQEVTVLENTYNIEKYSAKLIIEYDSDNSNYLYINENKLELLKENNRLELDLNPSKEDYHIFLNFTNKGYLKIKNIKVIKTNIYLKRVFLYLTFIFAFVDFLIIYFSKIKRNIKEIILLTFLVVLISMPLVFKGINKAHDLSYHLNRIEVLSLAIKDKTLPNYVSMSWLNGYGYPSSIYYPDLFLYIPAILRNLNFDITTTYKIYILLINTIGTFIAFYSFKKVFKSKKKGLLATYLYQTGSYHFLNIFIRGALGEYTAAIFLPLLFLSIYNIYTNENKSDKRFKEPLMLALSMTFIIESHILSAEMCVFILSIICLILRKKTFTKEVIMVYLKAIVITILLNLFFIVPFLDYYFNVETKISEIIKNRLLGNVQGGGVYPFEYFTFFKSLFGFNSNKFVERMNYAPGIMLMIGLIIAIYMLRKKKSNDQINFFLGLTLFTMYLASDLFPWNLLSFTKLGNILCQIQYPWRYLSYVLLFSSVLCIYVLDNLSIKKKKVFVISTFILTVVMSLFYTYDYYTNSKFVNVLYKDNLDLTNIGNEEYLVKDTNKSNLTSKNFEIITKKSDELTLKINGKISNKVELPVINYPNYKVFDEENNELEIENSKNNLIEIRLPSYYDGKIIVKYQPKISYIVALYISLITFISLIILKLTIK